MRSLERNKRTAYYAYQTGVERMTDSDGNKLAEKKITYSEPVMFKATISSPRGGFANLAFGRLDINDRIVYDGGNKLKFDEKYIIWLNNSPQTDEADYKVVAVQDSLNNQRILIRRRNVSSNLNG